MPVRGELDTYGKLLARINIAFKKFTQEQLEDVKKIFEAGREGLEGDL